MKRIACILLPLFVLAGCTVTATPSDLSSDDMSEDEAPKAKKKKSTTKTEETADATEAAPTTAPAATTVPATDTPATPAGPDVTYTFTTPATDTAAFGGQTADGKEVCGLQNFKDVTITVVATSTGAVKSFDFKGTNVEQANPKCAGVTAAPANLHQYTFTAATPTTSATKLVAAPANRPQADLVADVAVHGDAGGRATVHFHRSDAASPLDWKYTLQFLLTKSP